MPIVHDLVAHVDWCSVFRERTFDDVDRANHAGTEPARLRKDDPHSFTHVPEVEAPFAIEGAAAMFGPHPIYYALFDNLSREWPREHS
jgi:hypothetical protein